MTYALQHNFYDYSLRYLPIIYDISDIKHKPLDISILTKIDHGFDQI